MSKSIAVLGLGRFGKKLALGLYENGVDVMAVDRDQKLIDSISDKVTYALVADFSNAESIKGIGLEEMDTVVVAMGSDLTASIMAVMISKELGVPYVMAKASDERMGAILTKVGADEVIYPEEEMGERTARILVFDSFLEFFEIDDNLCMLEMKPKEAWIGKNLKELNLREKYSMNVVAIKNKNGMKSHINPDKPLDDDMTLLVIIDKADLKKLK